MRWFRQWLVAGTAIGSLLPGLARSQTPAGTQAYQASARDSALRVVISIARRRLWVVEGAGDTLWQAPVAIGSGRTLATRGASWTFATPRGVLRVLSKEVDPVWVRPDWSYIETARKSHLGIAHLDDAHPKELPDGTLLLMHDRMAGILEDSVFTPLPVDEEIVFDKVLYIPPVESLNRRVSGQLGSYRLNLGDGIGLHGTPDPASVGRAVTHGCLRLYDDDLAWVYEHVPVGTRVYIF